jgi:hypothetical protein
MDPMKKYLGVIAVMALSIILRAQHPGVCVTYAGAPPSTSEEVAFDPTGADYFSPEGATGGITIGGVTVGGCTWKRHATTLEVYVDGEYIGSVFGYFNWFSQIDITPGDGVSNPVDGGGTYDAKGAPAGYWVRK